MSPYRIYKTLKLRDADGPMTARQIAAAWAVIPEEKVRPEAEARIGLMLTVMAKRGMVRHVPATWSDDDAWEVIPLPENDLARKNLLRRVDRDWKRARDAQA